MTKRIEADWNTWAFIPTTTLQEAVFLSLDFEPAPQGFNGALVMAYAKAGRTDPIADLREFDRRMKIASANVEELAGSSVAYFRDIHVRNAKVSLAKFGTWAEGIGWSLPDKFPRQTAPVQPIDATDNEADASTLVAAKNEPAPAQTPTIPAPVVAVVAASDGPEPLPAAPNWKMRVQAEATELFLRLLASGANPTPHSILDSMAQWCRDNEVKTDTNINPSANYLRTHVLGGRHWSPPTMSREQAKKHVAQVAQTKVAQVAQ